MDTGDPSQDDVKRKGAKGKKKKEKKISLDEFLAKNNKDAGPAAPPPKSNSWAIMAENPEDEDEGSFKFDRSTLPSAPKAAMGPAVDLDSIPNSGPFSAYIGNLSYDASEDDLHRFFSQLEIDTVRIIMDGGRPRGYAYVDFLTKESLVEALSYNEKEYMGRTIKVDLATDKNHDSRGGSHGGPGRSNEPDRTDSDWRRREPGEAAPTPAKTFGSRDETDRGGRFGDRDRGYGFGGDRRSGFGDRDRGFGGDRDRERGFGGDRSFGDRDRGFGGNRDRDFGGNRDRDFGDRDRGRFGGSNRSGGYERADDYGRQNRQDNGFDRRASSRDGERDRGFGGERDRDFGDRDRGNRYEPPKDRGFGGDRARDFGDRDRGSRYEPPRGGGGYDRRDNDRRDNGSDRRPSSRDGSQERRPSGPKERPVLKLQPRSKPAEAKENQPNEPVQKSASIFGSAKPVDTYAKEKEIEEKLRKKDGDKESFRRKENEPRRQGDEGSAPPSRREGAPSSRGYEEDDVSSNGPQSPTSPKSAEVQQPKMVPAPLPKDNPWGRKTSPAPGQDSSNNYSSARRDDRQKPHPGAGRDQQRERRPGPRANGDDGSVKSKPVREKQLPKSIDEMPKYEENKAKDFSSATKFSFLMPEDEDDGSDANDKAAAEQS